MMSSCNGILCVSVNVCEFFSHVLVCSQEIPIVITAHTYTAYGSENKFPFEITDTVLGRKTNSMLKLIREH